MKKSSGLKKKAGFVTAAFALAVFSAVFFVLEGEERPPEQSGTISPASPARSSLHSGEDYSLADIVVSEDILGDLLQYHKLWIDSKGEKGNRFQVAKADLREANLEGAFLQWADMEETNLQKANLKGAYLRRAEMYNVHLEGAILQGADLCLANMKKAHLDGANLMRARLKGTYLQKSDLRWANLSGANLQGAHLQGANLEGADLKDAYLCWADLRWANLRRADLTGANLSGTRITYDPEELVYIDFSVAKNIEKVKFFDPEKGKELPHIKINPETGKVIDTSVTSMKPSSPNPVYG